MDIKTKIRQIVTSSSVTMALVLVAFAAVGVIAIVMSRATTGTQPLGVTGSWSSVWADEFTGTSLNSANWNVMESWNAPPGAKFVDADTWCPLPMPAHINVVNNGTLKMNLLTEPAGGQPTQACEINTRGKFENFTEGYIESRIKVPAGAELWTAFWLMGNGTGTDGWPRTGEIDIFEFVNNGSGHGTPFFSTHWYGPCDAWSHCAKTQDSPWPAPIADYSSRFVTYGLKRTASGLEIYIDGVFKYKFTPETKNSYGQTMPSYIFNGPMHVILTNKSGGNWGRDPNKGPEPGTMEIDYVRAWVPAAATGDTTAPAVSVTAPASGATLSGSTKVTASASDAGGITKAELYVDGALRGTDSAAPYEFTFDTTILSNGAHSLQVKASDAAGNTGASSLVSFTSSNTITELPDVVVTAVAMAPAAQKSGDMTVFSATIKNQGTGPTPAGVPVGVRYDINGTQTHWAATGALAAGESRTVSATNSMTSPDVSYWSAVTGSHTLEAYVDDVNRFAETNETNNKLNKAFTVGSITKVSQINNLATGKTFVSNVGTIENTVIANINNQNEADRWISVAQDNVTIGTDLGSSYTLNKVSILWAGDTTKNYDLQMSADKVTWKTLATGTTNNTTPQLLDTTSFTSPATGRYFRILTKDRWNLAYGNSIWEIGLYGSQASVAGNGDANKDGRVNALDLSVLISRDGQAYAAADFNGDGTVGAADMAILLSKWTW